MSSLQSPLAEFSTCEISDALIKLGVPHGGHVSDVHMLSPTIGSSRTRICGPAYTVKMVLASDSEAPTLSTHFVDTAPAGSVIFIEAPPEAKNAVWGGLMTAGAQARSVVGVVILGRCRDLAEHRSLAFPVFAIGHSTLGQASFTRPSCVNVPLNIVSTDSFPVVHVKPDDWVIADEDGVVCVPRALEARVRDVASRGREMDALCMQSIKAGAGVQASFKLHRGSG